MTQVTALRQAQFVVAAHDASQWMPDDGAEVAFAGRSNSGKSSAINAITGRKGLAITSKTPGRTQQIVFFEVAGTGRLVDLPGYGFSRVSKSLRNHWGREIADYFRTRQSLKGLMLMMDIRHPLKPLDEQLIALSLCADIPIHILLTKSDKLSKSKALAVAASVNKTFGEIGQISVQVFSSHTRTGVEHARDAVFGFLQDDR